MSFRKLTRYTLKCDMCGQPYRQEDAARPIVDTKQRLLDRATADDWQTSDDYTSDDYQYCPQHWHVTCRECGTSVVAPLSRLEQDGWVNATPGPLSPEKYGDVRHDLTYMTGWGFICPKCAPAWEQMDKEKH